MKVCSQLLSQVQFGNGLRFVLRVCRLGRSGSGSHMGEEGRRVGQNGWLKSQALPAKSQASAGPWRTDAPRCCASVGAAGKGGTCCPACSVTGGSLGVFAALHSGRGSFLRLRSFWKPLSRKLRSQGRWKARANAWGPGGGLRRRSQQWLCHELSWIGDSCEMVKPKGR